MKFPREKYPCSSCKHIFETSGMKFCAACFGKEDHVNWKPCEEKETPKGYNKGDKVRILHEGRIGDPWHCFKKGQECTIYRDYDATVDLISIEGLDLRHGNMCVQFLRQKDFEVIEEVVYTEEDKKVNLVEQGDTSTGRRQVGGSHYKMAIEPIDYIVKNKLGYREGNVVKYVSRHDKKNGAEDIKKAIHYLEMILEDYDE